MKCVICKNGETEQGYSLVAMSRNDFIVVFKNVPAEICTNCGEEYVDGKVTNVLLKTAEESFNTGVVLDVREYRAA